MSSLRELAALSNSSELKEQMLYANRLEMTKSCLISEELNRVIGYLTRQINSRENLIEELRGLPASFFHDIAIMYNNIVCAEFKSSKCSIMQLIEEVHQNYRMKLFMDNEQHRHNGYTANQLNVNKQQGTKAKRNSGVGDAEDRRKIRNRKYYLRHNHPEVFSDEGGSDHINGASNLNISNRVPFGMLENTIRNESPQYGRFVNSNETVVTTCLSPFEECTVASNKENIVSSGRCMFNQTGIERFSDTRKGRNRRHYIKNHQTYTSLNDEGCSTAMNVEVNMDGSTSLVSDETLVTDKDCSESILVLQKLENDV
ncbi:hypothetical protein Tco_1020943 [Tanacetum coccineum]